MVNKSVFCRVKADFFPFEHWTGFQTPLKIRTKFHPDFEWHSDSELFTDRTAF